MSTLAISNHLFLRLLQRQNTKRVIAKKMDINMNKVDFETIPMLDGKEKENMGAEVKINIGAASVSVPPQVYVATNDTEVTKIEL
jgi:hypothetical protein